VPAPVSSATLRSGYFRTGFRWDAADVYLFDIDGTVLNCRDSVHFDAFHQAFRDVMGVAASLDGLFLHGNTDLGILRAALEREGIPDTLIESRMSHIVERMCSEVLRNREQMHPELCPSICDLISYLAARGKLLAVASGNLEPIGWAKLQKAGIRQSFSFGSFAWPRESRAEIFKHGVSWARERLGQSANVCVIGDTPADVDAARAAGINIIVLATGIYDFAELRAAQPDACCTSALDLLTLQV